MSTPALYVDASIQTAYTRAELVAYAGRPYADLQHYTTFIPENIDTQYTRMEFQRAILGLRDIAVLVDAAVQVLTDAATIAWDAALGRNASVTLGGNRTLGAPSNLHAGMNGTLTITQDSTGGRTLAYNVVWKFPYGTPTLSTVGASKNVLHWYTPDGTNCYAMLDGQNLSLGISGSDLGQITLLNATSGSVILKTVTGALGGTQVQLFPAATGTFLLDSSSLNASNLLSGTVPDARLSANVAMLNAANSFGTNAAPFNQTILIAAGAAGFKIQEGFSGGPYERFSVSVDSGHLTSVITDGTYYGANMVLTGNAQFNGGGISVYKNITTAGFGVPAIVARGRVTTQSSAAAAITTFTPAADGTFEICGNVLVTTVGTINATMTCTYTDESNTSRTLTLPFTLLAGTQTTAINAAVPYHGVPLKIRAKAGTAITIQTVGTFTGSPVYNAEADIRQVAA